MIRRHFIATAVTATAFASLIPSQSFAAGFEKVVTWSGKQAGVAGAGVATVAGAEGLYFNPAALATGGEGKADVSWNFSPTFGQFTGPITTNGQQLDSARKLSPVFGAVADYHVNSQFGVGVGAFVSGGTKAIFENVDFRTANANLDTINPKIASDLSVVEISLGAGYELMPRLKLGAAWRAVLVNATLGTAVTSGSSLISFISEDLSATRYNGVKVGAQWTSEANDFGFGASWRSEIDFTAEGTSTGKLETATGVPASAQDLSGGPITVGATFPTQVTLGAFWQITKSVRVIPEYVWTEYSKNQALATAGTLGIPAALGGGTVTLSNLTLNWQNQTNLRFGVECTALEGWIFRGGYAWTSQVTPLGNARATFASPGVGNTFTLGAGTKVGKVDVNAAAEYSFASGTVTTETTPTGEYKSNVFAGHLGVSYSL